MAGYLATYLPPTTHLKWFTNLDSKKRKRRGNTKALAKDKEAVTHAFSVNFCGCAWGMGLLIVVA